MATATHAVASAAASGSVPTASPFAKLLRRSRFASFDPNIRQTYSSPKAHAHRGDFGLKCPLTIRRKNAFITLSAPFDAREQYVEWVKGESQVRFIRRYEEMDMNASVPHTSAWYKNQSSKTATDWLIDSEFCDEAERPEASEGMSIDDLVKAKLKEPVGPIRTDLAGVSVKMADVERARHAVAVTTSGLSPNIEAMSEAEFDHFRYEEHNDKDLYKLAQNTENLHRRFLEEVTFNEPFRSSRSKKIEPKPHRVGGLLYHHPSKLHSYMFAKMEPGLLLQIDDVSQHRAVITPQAGYNSGIMISFGGLRTSIPYLPGDKFSLYHHREGMGTTDPDLADKTSMEEMRLMPGMVTINSLPRTVGRNASGVKGIRMRATVTVDKQLEYYYPYFPWDPRYAPEENMEDGAGHAPESMDAFDIMDFQNNPETAWLANSVLESPEKYLKEYAPLLGVKGLDPEPLKAGPMETQTTEEERKANNISVLDMLVKLSGPQAPQTEAASQAKHQTLDPAQNAALNMFSMLSTPRTESSEEAERKAATMDYLDRLVEKMDQEKKP
ncbi:hypothetical protein BDZ89DRAFT_1078976 [Hymenopellis radicata]|nr:hypothetical protein BDZ89DRAFT_1078976 [Hymenopellis radicata]